MLYLYVITALLWGVYAVKQQKFYHPGCPIGKMMAVFLVNTLFAPICVMVATTNPEWLKI